MNAFRHFTDFLHDPNPATWASRSSAFAAEADEAAVRRLLNALADGGLDQQKRGAVFVVVLLVNRQEFAELPGMLECVASLLESVNPAVRGLACQAAGEGNLEALRAKIEALTKDVTPIPEAWFEEEGTVGAWATQALLRFGAR